MTEIANSLLAQSSSGATSSARSSVSQTFDDFLGLLTTQLTNQDPLDPTDPSEFTNQLVEFSQVEQLIAQTEKLESLDTLANTLQTQSALNYVGRDVTVIGSRFSYDGEEPMELVYALDDTAATVGISIMDAEGNVVLQADGERTQGRHTFTFEGLDEQGDALEAGNYIMKIAALDSDGATVSSSTAVPGRVTGVQTADGAITLLLGGVSASFDQVIEVRE